MPGTSPLPGSRESRRQFIRKGSAAAVGAAFTGSAGGQQTRAAIFVLSDASDARVALAPVQWATGELRNALAARGLTAQVHHNLDPIHQAGERIVIAPAGSEAARQIAGQANVAVPDRAESLALAAGRLRNEPVVLVTGRDVRGLVYGILEVADRVQNADDPMAALRRIDRITEQPANEIRSATRLFVSDIEDKPWFYDKTSWAAYLSMLASQRFNRFSLTLGLGYDLPRHVLDSYFIFAYPFLLSVPGYKVTVPGLPAEEPQRNLEMLRWISSETARRGLHFQLGLWSHTYEWIDSPKANYLIEGLTPQNHASYCRDALRMLLQSCPAISGITFRAHSESGIRDGSYDFWKTVFQGVAECGRRVEIDLHSKGIEFRHIQMALDTGQPVLVSMKYTAEHMGLPGHQAAIRELERSRPSSTPAERSATRYGYADYLSEDRPYGVYFRMWPGKDKAVLWADPAMAAGYGRHAGFCGSLGLEWCEPLSFKGRQGSGSTPDRRIYADNSLAPAGGDWKKYLYAYRIWGRHLYNPDTNPDSYRRYLAREFGEAAASVETSLGHASRVIPLITSAHMPSASAMSYWPEVYANMPIADEKLPHPYGDTPAPKVFGRVSPLDPAMFTAVNEFVDEMIGGSRSGRYSPADVARWLEEFARTAGQHLQQARRRARDAKDAAFRRLEIDVEVQAGLGLFFAEKLRAAVSYALYQKNGDAAALRDAVFFYREARQAWAGIVKRTKNVYVDDLSFGEPAHRRGHWADRLPAIDQDVAYMERLLKEKSGGRAGDLPRPNPDWLRPRPPRPECGHDRPAGFRPGQPLEIGLRLKAEAVESVLLHYRHVNQAEPYRIEKMSAGGGFWRHAIPGEYTDSSFPLLYYFEIHGRKGEAWLYPGFERELANQPYFVVRRI